MKSFHQLSSFPHKNVSLHSNLVDHPHIDCQILALYLTPKTKREVFSKAIIFCDVRDTGGSKFHQKRLTAPHQEPSEFQHFFLKTGKCFGLKSLMNGISFPCIRLRITGPAGNLDLHTLQKGLRIPCALSKKTVKAWNEQNLEFMILKNTRKQTK